MDQSDAPLVTLVLFAYNQEKFIRQAMEGAFAQTYRPLEIIVSDDCSPDETFTIMSEVAAAYSGPHRVRLNRNPRNKGLTSHFLDICGEATGSIVAVSAGDDISYPHRVETLVQRFGADQDIYCVTSGFDVVNGQGSIISAGVVEPLAAQTGQRQKTYLATKGDDYKIIQGSTASYRKELFELEYPPFPLLCAEDQLMNYLVYAMGKRVEHVPAPLIAYRKHEEALSHRTERQTNSRRAETLTFKQLRARDSLVRAIVWFAESESRVSGTDWSEVNAERNYVGDRVAWAEATLGARIGILLKNIRKKDLSFSIWAAMRLFGRYPNYYPKRLVHGLQNALRR